MISSPPIWSQRRAGLFVALLIVLLSIYMLSYSAQIESGDSLQLFDVASSLARYSDTGRDVSAWFVPPTNIDTNALYPLAQNPLQETLPVFLAAMLYRVVDFLPGVGYVHVVWLLNVWVTALTAGLLFWWAVALRADDRAALMLALFFGIGTIAWPYSKTLFREPLVALFLVAAALSIEVWRRVGYMRSIRAFIPLTLALVAVVAALNTKSSAMMALPALVILALPRINIPQHIYRGVIMAMVAAVFLLLLMAADENIYTTLVGMVMPWLERYGADATFGRDALAAYLLSPGGSLWGTSPVLLMAVPGAVLLLRRGQPRLVIGIVALISVYALGHALLTGVHWFGGLSWPPRFLVPVMPVACILLLPILNHLVRRELPRYSILILILITLYSLWVQFNGVAQFWAFYADVLPPEANRLLEWWPGLSDPRYWRWVLLPQLWGPLGFDFAWSRTDGLWWMRGYVLVVVIVCSLIGIVFRWPPRLKRRFGAGLLTLGVMWLALTGSFMQHLHARDGLYFAQSDALAQVWAIVADEAAPGDPLLLADNTYARYVMNFDRTQWPRVIALPVQPGERASERDMLRVESHNPVDLLTLQTPRMIDLLATKHERIWLLAHNSAFLPWSIRPVERYMSQYYYLLREFNTDDPAVRLLEYATVPAPQLYNFMGPEYLSDLRYGDAIQLAGYTLPRGFEYIPGDVLPLSLYWVATENLEADYVVAWFLGSEADEIPHLQGMDAEPYSGFAPTSTWQSGLPVWDHRAVRLPPDLPPGNYRIWVVLYERTARGGERLPVTGMDVINDDIGVLPVHIVVVPQR